MSAQNTLNSNSHSDEPPLLSRPVVLLLIDGWGIASANQENAIVDTPTPVFDDLINKYPVALLSSSALSWNARYQSIGTGQEILDEKQKTRFSLSSILAQAKLKQIKITVVERLAALTYFFNGASDQKYPQEELRLIPSVDGSSGKQVLVTLQESIQEAIQAIKLEKNLDLLVLALPVLDLLAQKSDFLGLQQAIEIIDKGFHLILKALNAKNGVLIISAAGGGAEQIHNPETGLLDNYQINNPVPVIIVGSEFRGKTIGLVDPLNNDLSSLAPAGTLADLAPTILNILGLNPSEDMTGKSLLEKKST